MMSYCCSATYSCFRGRVSPVVANKPIVSRGNCASPCHFRTSGKFITLDFLFLLFNAFQPVPELTRSPLAWIRNPTDSEQLPASYPTPSETPAPSLVDSSDANNSRVGLEDPTSKVLPAALKKNRIKEEEWGDYAMFISYGPAGEWYLLKSPNYH